MRKLSLVLLIVGVTLVIGLVAWRGVGAVTDVLGIAGWRLLWMAAYYTLSLIMTALAWWCLFPPSERPSLPLVVFVQWVGQSINTLLPAAQIGGEVAKARLIIHKGISTTLAAASVVVHTTVRSAAQILIALLGVALLARQAGGDDWIPALLSVSAILGVLIYIFYRVQQAGLFQLIARVAKRLSPGLPLDRWIGGAEALEAGIRDLYRRVWAVAISCALRVVARLLIAGEVWLALYLMGHPITPVEALLLETLNQTMRAAAFLVPGSYGVQDGGYVLVGLLIGLAPEVALALALAIRAREFILGIPALLAWEFVEGRVLLHGNKHIPRNPD